MNFVACSRSRILLRFPVTGIWGTLPVRSGILPCSALVRASLAATILRRTSRSGTGRASACRRLAGLDRRIHLRDLVLADQVADRRRADHDLVRRHPASAVLGLAAASARSPRAAIRTASRTISFSAAGNTSTIRSMVLAADWCAACRTPGGRFRPRSAPGGWFQVAHLATRITSGSSRSADAARC